MELPALLGVDLVHCERQAAALAAESAGSVLEAQGELITTQVGGRRRGAAGGIWSMWESHTCDCLGV